MLLPVPEEVDDEEQAEDLEGDDGDEDRQPFVMDGSASTSLNLASKPRHPEGGLLAVAKSTSDPLPTELVPSANRHLGWPPTTMVVDIPAEVRASAMVWV